jgi:hypothetical protein
MRFDSHRKPDAKQSIQLFFNVYFQPKLPDKLKRGSEQCLWRG